MPKTQEQIFGDVPGQQQELVMPTVWRRAPLALRESGLRGKLPCRCKKSGDAVLPNQTKPNQTKPNQTNVVGACF